jgi:lycopene cyclase domain-containing protein
VTYAEFLLLFVCPPALASVLLFGRSQRRWAPIVALLAIVYATASPWDNAAVRAGLWRFSPAQTTGVTIGALPLEEYAFFGLQTLLVGFWVLARLERR